MRIELSTPRNYWEVSEKQLRYIAALQVAGMSYETILSKCFVSFAGINIIERKEDICFFRVNKKKEIHAMDIQEFSYFVETMNWILKNYIGITPIAKIRDAKAIDKLLRDVPFKQYLAAENYYQAFLHTGKNEFLYKLMSCLFFRHGLTFNEMYIDKSAKYLKRWSNKIDAQITIMWMVGIKKYFSRKWTYLFRMEDSSMESAGHAPDMYAVMQNQLRALTNGDITKNDAVLNSLTWDALNELNEKSKEAENLKRMSNK